MTEKPMIFTGESVRAILVGRKTQTRRAVKDAGVIACLEAAESGGLIGITTESVVEGSPHPVGSRVWVKEWLRFENGEHRYEDGVRLNHHARCQLKQRGYSSMFCPRRASRLTLEITEVRVQRVQDISQADAYAEGVQDWEERQDTITGEPCQVQLNPIEEYANLWDRINGKRHPWSSNPWVWVYEFKRV